MATKKELPSSYEGFLELIDGAEGPELHSALAELRMQELLLAINPNFRSAPSSFLCNEGCMYIIHSSAGGQVSSAHSLKPRISRLFSSIHHCHTHIATQEMHVLLPSETSRSVVNTIRCMQADWSLCTWRVRRQVD